MQANVIPTNYYTQALASGDKAQLIQAALETVRTEKGWDYLDAQFVSLSDTAAFKIDESKVKDAADALRKVRRLLAKGTKSYADLIGGNAIA